MEPESSCAEVEGTGGEPEPSGAARWEPEPSLAARWDMLSEKAAGLRAEVEKASSLLSGVLAELDCDRTPGADATVLYAAFCRAERLVSAAKAVLAARVEWSGVWQLSEHSDAAGLLAEVEGVSPGAAKRTLSLGRRLPSLPATEAALRRGELSVKKAEELTRTAVTDPSLEAELLVGASEEPFSVLSDRCRAVREESRGEAPETAPLDEEVQRRFSSWTDASGAFCYEGRDTQERGEALLAHLGEASRMLRAARREAGVAIEGPAVLRADALFALVTGEARPSLRRVNGVAVYSEGSFPLPRTGAAPAGPEDEPGEPVADPDAWGPEAARADTGPWTAPSGADPEAAPADTEPWADDVTSHLLPWPSGDDSYTQRE